MELATIFLIWLAITVIDNMAKRKKRRLPPPETPDFEIPTITVNQIESAQAYERDDNASDTQRHGATSGSSVTLAAQIERKAEKPKPLNLTPSTVMEAFVLSEIIGKPKALRRSFFNR